MALWFFMRILSKAMAGVMANRPVLLHTYFQASYHRANLFYTFPFQGGGCGDRQRLSLTPKNTQNSLHLCEKSVDLQAMGNQTGAIMNAFWVLAMVVGALLDFGLLYHGKIGCRYVGRHRFFRQKPAGWVEGHLDHTLAPMGGKCPVGVSKTMHVWSSESLAPVSLGRASAQPSRRWYGQETDLWVMFPLTRKEKTIRI